MGTIDIDAVVQAYLGGEPETAGIQPYGMAERLREHCGERFEECHAVVERLLAKTMAFECPMPADGDLALIGDAVSRWLESEEPALRASTRRKLADYYSYNQR